MGFSICVYASSSQSLQPEHYAIAGEMGRLMGEQGFDLVYGAGQVGTMGSIADGVRAAGGRIVGVIPEKLNLKGVAYEHCSELIVTKELRSRKQKMESLADGFLAMPGGFGTLDELLEIIAAKQLGYHAKPIVIFNYNGFFDALLTQFAQMTAQHFASPEHQTLYFAAETPQAALDYFRRYTPRTLKPKWEGYTQL